MDKSRIERNSNFSEPMIEIAEAKSKLANGAVALDVRTPAEVAEGTWPGAVCIPHTELSHRLQELHKFREQEIVIYCKVGGRADFALQVLKSNGFLNVYNAGGLSELL